MLLCFRPTLYPFFNVKEIRGSPMRGEELQNEKFSSKLIMEKRALKDMQINWQNKRLCISPPWIKVFYCWIGILRKTQTDSSAQVWTELLRNYKDVLAYLLGTTPPPPQQHNKQVACTSTESAESTSILKSWTMFATIHCNFIVFSTMLCTLFFFFFLQGVPTGNAWIMGRGRWRAITPIVNPFWRRRFVWRSNLALSFIL